MARFSFRLQPLLKVKEQIEEQKEIEYGQALRKLEEEKQKLKMLHMKREENIRDFRESLHTGIRPPDIRRYNDTLEMLKRRIIDQEKRIEAAEAFVEKKRLELVEAMKERKMLDTVKEKRFEEYILDEKLAEQKQVDERVSYQYS
jgi:flagellar FliJ protein